MAYPKPRPTRETAQRVADIFAGKCANDGTASMQDILDDISQEEADSARNKEATDAKRKFAVRMLLGRSNVMDRIRGKKKRRVIRRGKKKRTRKK